MPAVVSCTTQARNRQICEQHVGPSQRATKLPFMPSILACGRSIAWYGRGCGARHGSGRGTLPKVVAWVAQCSASAGCRSRWRPASRLRSSGHLLFPLSRAQTGVPRRATGLLCSTPRHTAHSPIHVKEGVLDGRLAYGPGPQRVDYTFIT